MTHSDQQNGKKSALASSKDDRTLQEFGIDTSPTFPNGVINTSQPSMTLSCHQNEKSSSSAEDKANAFDGDEKYDGFRDTVVHFENASELLDGTPTEKEAGGNPDLEPILPEDEDVKEELLEGDAAVADITAGVGQKKKKKKRKPKSQRGLVCWQVLPINLSHLIGVSCRKTPQDLRTTMWTLLSLLQSMNKRKGCMTCLVHSQNVSKQQFNALRPNATWTQSEAIFLASISNMAVSREGRKCSLGVSTRRYLSPTMHKILPQ